MAIENETRELFMSLPTWNARDALRMLLEVNPYSVIQEDDFDGTEIEQEARALMRWLYRYGILPRAIREPDDAAPELIDDYLDAIGEVRRTPVEWITAATANPGAPEEWLALLQPLSGAPESNERPQYSPRTGWQIAMFEAWPAMRKLHGREPSAAEAIRYLKKNDTSGTILGKGGEKELWWKPTRGSAKEVQFKTVESCISSWRTSGKLPA